MSYCSYCEFSAPNHSRYLKHLGTKKHAIKYLEATKDLDENGMIRIGAEVNSGDILIGKITPKGESDPTPEEKLLRAIFGDKAGDVKDASLKAPPSLQGVVIDKKLFTRSIKDKRKRNQDKQELESLEKVYDEKFDVLKNADNL